MAKKNIKTHSKKKKANALIEQKKFAEAYELYQKICVIDPRDAEAWESLGMCQAVLGDKQAAIKSLQKALLLKPNSAQALYNQAVMYREQGQFETAEQLFAKAISFKQDYVEAYYALGSLLISSNKLDQAEQVFEKFAQVQPRNVDAYVNLGGVQQAGGKLTSAIENYNKAISINNNSPVAYENLANTYAVMGRYEESVSAYKRALELDSANPKAISNYLLTLNYIEGLGNQYIYEEHCKYAKLYCGGKKQHTHNQHVSTEKRKLKIGYVSSDFRMHSVAYFMESILANHNKDDFEIVCYSGVPLHDQVTDRFEKYADQWREIHNQSVNDVSDRIKRDNVDILVDLGGHTSGNHLSIFCKKPAPVQVSYLGYPNTTGMKQMDYRITDLIADPQGQDDFYSEKLIRKEGCFLCYQSLNDCPDVSELPFEINGHITFGSFNNLAKIGPQVIKVWAQVLKQIPDSRIIIKNPSLSDAKVRDVYLQKFETEGIDTGRIELVGLIKEVAEHLDLYRRVDIGLDTFPYNGTTTTCEALWMGVPVITLAGQHHASRVGASLLTAIGYEELVCDSAQSYIKRAQNLSADTDRLKQIRQSMRNELQQSPLCNAEQFTAELESVYSQMWETQCSLKP